MKMTASSSMKMMMRQKVVGAMLQSAKGIMSQAKFDHGSETDYHDEEHTIDHVPKAERLRIHVNNTDEFLKVNLEHVPSNLQKELAEELGPFLQINESDEHIPEVTFNYLSEEVFRTNLYMAFRKLGYDCTFSRYNHDKGLATFTLADHEGPSRKYSYFRTGQPNQC